MGERIRDGFDAFKSKLALVINSEKINEMEIKIRRSHSVEYMHYFEFKIK